jgi:TRAP-type uncharacterized transport system substrate-binding protein
MTEKKVSLTPIVDHLRANRLRLLLAVLGAIAIIASIMWLAFKVLHPIPERTLVMAVYPEGTLNAQLAKRYREVLARDGVKLTLDPSAGAVESIADLRDPKSATSIALVPGGITTEQESPELVSLGTLFYQPLWIFSRHPLQGRHLHGLRISIGPEGSSSHAIADKLLGSAGIIDPKSATLLSLTQSESAQELIRGDIDIAIFLDAWDSPAVQQLLHAKDIFLASVPRADAFVALYPYLSKLVLPAGVIDLAEPRPATDVLLIAPKSSLVIRRDLHPAIQYLLLEAAVEIHSKPGVFQRAGQFPAAESVDLPLSPYAREFYRSGMPFLQRHLPFWLAILLEQPLVWLLSLIAILFPILRIAPAIYDWAESRRVYRLYSELKLLEDEIGLAAPGINHREFIERLDRLKIRANRLSVPSSYRPLVYALRLYIEVVRRDALKSITREHRVTNPPS